MPLSNGGTFSYLNSLYGAGIIGFALLVSMTLSSSIGTLIPMFFHSIHVDPAVASGPLITTLKDLVAVTVYYGLSYILLMQLI